MKEWVENNEELPSNVKNYTLEWLKEGLNDWIMTRDMKWGVPVPLEDAEGKVIYVWGKHSLDIFPQLLSGQRKIKKDWKNIGTVGPYISLKRYNISPHNLLACYVNGLWL